MWKKRALISVFLLTSIVPGMVLASTTDGTIDSTNKYAWGENTGYINFGNSYGDIHVTDSAITGYAWSENYGWINLSPANSGVLNDAEGNLSGSAWSEGLGYISFAGVTINSSGNFVGIASGTVAGQVSFNCSNCTVNTDWRPQSSRTTAVAPAASNRGGVPAQAVNPPVAPTGGFKVSINDDAIETDSKNVILTLRGGSDTARMTISNFSDFRDSQQEFYRTTKNWTLVANSDNEKRTVYVKFYAQSWGMPSEVVSDNIIYKAGSSAFISAPFSTSTELIAESPVAP